MATRILLRHSTCSFVVSKTAKPLTLLNPRARARTCAVQLPVAVSLTNAASIQKPSVIGKGKSKKGSSPGKSGYDQIGPLQPDSNLRPVRFHIPPDESLAEKRFRQLREETQKWHEEFWAKHNRRFYTQKQAFIEQKLSEMRRKNPRDAKMRLTAEELSKFYKQFLDENYKLHTQYNREWYGRNAGLLLPALRVNIERFFKKGR